MSRFENECYWEIISQIVAILLTNTYDNYSFAILK